MGTHLLCAAVNKIENSYLRGYGWCRDGKITCQALVASFLSFLDASVAAEVLHELAALMPGRKEELEQAAGSCPKPVS